MTAAALPREALELIERMLDPTIRDRSYQQLTRLGASVADYLAWKRDEDGAAERTLDQYERDLARMSTILASKAPGEVTKADIRKVLLAFPEGSRDRARAALRNYWTWLYDESDEPGFPWRIDRDPMRGIRSSRRKRRQQRTVLPIFTDAEEAALITRGPAVDHGRAIEIRDRTCVLLLLRTGVRAYGMRHLQVADIDLISKWIVVRQEKGGDGRIVPIRGDVIGALEEFMLTPIPRVREGGELVERAPVTSDYLLYPNGAGRHGLTWTDPSRPRVYSAFWRWWAGIVERAAVDYRKPHMTRHTFGTKLRRSGADSEEVQKALGHRSPNSTLLYLHQDVRAVESAIERRQREIEAQEV